MIYFLIFVLGFSFCKVYASISYSIKSKIIPNWSGHWLAKDGDANDKFWSDMTNFMKKNFREGDIATIYVEKKK
jgi:hypothetical protein